MVLCSRDVGESTESRGVELRGGSLRFSRGSESFAACDVARVASVGWEVLSEGVAFMGVVYFEICGSFLIGRVVVLR
jgi:hypothetical protein